ncbi:MAG TPA: glycoside hydrolase family 15 protein [Protaetiibacter sp.]|nr:glycoside hydrolase family 15 protein [Protaetiibacter sp.]
MTDSPVLADREALAAIALEGRALIRGLQEPSGAYPASPTFSAYRGYSWFRDGAFIADAMSAGGDPASAEAFFDWCARVIVDRRSQVERIVAAAEAGTPVADEDMLAARFAFDGGDGSDEWWDFQLDGYGSWVWAVGAHVTRHGADPARWLDAIGLSVRYLASSWHRPCFDWWEMHADKVHSSTLGCVAAGLVAATALGLDPELTDLARTTAAEVEQALRRDGARGGHLVKWVGSDAVDASCAALVGPMGVLPGDDPLAVSTLREIDTQLTVDGGTHRFLADTYFGGGQWPLLGCFLGLAWIRAGRPERAVELLRFAASTAHDGGMPEQVDRHLLDPSFVEEWVERWGPSADPLLWSSAMFLRLAAELGVVEA